MSSAPDVVGEILGYRAWFVDTAVLVPARLTSLYDATVWEPRRWTVATCDLAEGVPHEGHRCGIHAARDRNHLRELGYNEEEGIVVIGEVALAGGVVPAEQGWRGEKGRPVRLWVPHAEWCLVRALGETYRVPVGLTNVLSKGGEGVRLRT